MSKTISDGKQALTGNVAASVSTKTTKMLEPTFMDGRPEMLEPTFFTSLVAKIKQPVTNFFATRRPPRT